MNVSPLPQLSLLCSALLAAWILPDPISALDVTFDPGTWTLSWACAADVAVTACSVTAPGVRRRRAEPRGCRCRFLPMELHRGAELEVNGTAGGEGVVRRLSFVNAGAANSGAEDLACEIRDARFLCCAWRAGPAAPADVQYSLRVLNSTGHDVARCSVPPGEDAAVTTHCRADDLSLLPRKAYVIVSGRSQAGPVRFLDAVVNTKKIERLSPPRDVTATCNSSHCAVAWAPPLTWADMSALDFRFEVEWKNTELGSAPQKVLISGPEAPSFAFPCPAPRGRHAVRVRAGDLRSERWSDWSPALELGSDDWRLPRAAVYAASGCAALLCALALGAAWRRLRRCPPVPGIADKVSDDERVNPETLRKDVLHPLAASA